MDQTSLLVLSGAEARDAVIRSARKGTTVIFVIMSLRGLGPE
jgi:hypothetical protein